jgi:hypothetical protein
MHEELFLALVVKKGFESKDEDVPPKVIDELLGRIQRLHCFMN